jgi:hypothetical protein
MGVCYLAKAFGRGNGVESQGCTFRSDWVANEECVSRQIFYNMKTLSLLQMEPLLGHRHLTSSSCSWSRINPSFHRTCRQDCWVLIPSFFLITSQAQTVPALHCAHNCNPSVLLIHVHNRMESLSIIFFIWLFHSVP